MPSGRRSRRYAQWEEVTSVCPQWERFIHNSGLKQLQERDGPALKLVQRTKHPDTGAGVWLVTLDRVRPSHNASYSKKVQIIDQIYFRSLSFYPESSVKLHHDVSEVDSLPPADELPDLRVVLGPEVVAHEVPVDAVPAALLLVQQDVGG